MISSQLCLLLWWFLIRVLSKIDAKCSPGCLASSCDRFLFNRYSKLMPNALLAALLLPMVVSCSIIIEIVAKRSPGVLFNAYSKMMRNTVKCSSGCLDSSCCSFLTNPYSQLISKALLAALLLPMVFFIKFSLKLLEHDLLATPLPPVVVSYSK